MSWNKLGGATAALGLTLLLAGCTQKMAVQPYNRPYTASDFFSDGSSARPIPADTVARGHTQDDTLLFTGKDANGQDSTQFPFPVTRDVLDRGRDRYEIYCVPCHGYTGDGDGLVVQRGFNPPPSYHSDRLRQAPVGHFFDVVSNGFGAMPSYAAQIPVQDRWAIIAYIRALQLSQNATLDDVPPDQQAQLEQQP
ncbi:MAG: cytochrome c [Chloroflexi bacterium]|nr:cytochrome c [Chloroflexota bacterium]MBV9602820.1 cytochrome c [Chloroflexota bacterium]